MIAPHDVMNDELLGGAANDDGYAVNRQDGECVPDLKAVGREEQAPGYGAAGKEEQGYPNQQTAVVAVGKGAGIDRKEKRGHPVADHRVSGQDRRFEDV